MGAGGALVDLTNSATFAQGSQIYFAPTFETNYPHYAWLNQVQAVANGIIEGDSVVFDVREAV